MRRIMFSITTLCANIATFFKLFCTTLTNQGHFSMFINMRKKKRYIKLTISFSLRLRKMNLKKITFILKTKAMKSYKSILLRKNLFLTIAQPSFGLIQLCINI